MGGTGRATPRDVVVPTAWEDFFEATGIPAAVRVGTTVRVTGHTGDNARYLQQSAASVVVEAFVGPGQQPPGPVEGVHLATPAAVA